MSTGNQEPNNRRTEFDRLERKEKEVWRLAILMLVILAVGVGVLSHQAFKRANGIWRRFRSGRASSSSCSGLPLEQETRDRRIARVRPRIPEGQDAPPSAEQLEKLAEVIAASRQGYRDLIDSLDHLIFTTSLNGEIRTVNQRIAEVFGFPYSELVGHRLDEFFDEPRLENLKESIAWFVEKRHWTGTVRARLKKTGAVHYFDCVLQAIVKDGKVVGASGLARDITAQRESETRFTELFETLQEGVYFCDPREPCWMSIRRWSACWDIPIGTNSWEPISASYISTCRWIRFRSARRRSTPRRSRGKSPCGGRMERRSFASTIPTRWATRSAA